VHPSPEEALCDGPQALVADDIAALGRAVREFPPLVGRHLTEGASTAIR
jgi:3-deoxy-7-phosphoheptulonate synthase